MDETESLLTIKQAAKILNVSEMSLRRWTNAGKLSCVRVGTHRSRRFRQQDLVNFIEKQGGDNKSTQNDREQCNLDVTRSHVNLEGVSIEYGSHLCSLYDDRTGRQKLAIPLLADGLKNGETCFLVATPDVQKEFLNELKDIKFDIKSAIKNGQLLVTDGEKNMEDMLSFLRTEFTKATRSGESPMRLVGDMSWALSKGWEPHEIFAYEHVYNSTLGHQYQIVSLCIYDVNDFTGKGVLSALRCHEDTFKFPLNRFFGTADHPVLVT